MKVSIITPTYNSENYISETIDAIIAQSYSNWELLITDDYSDDATWDIISTYADGDERIKVFRLQENGGAGVARNHSIEQASGRYMAFCDSDDLWLPHKLEVQVNFMRERELPFTFSAYQKIDEGGLKGGIVNVPKSLSYDELLRHCPIGCLTVIYDVGRIGKFFMPKIRKRQDYGLWLLIFEEIGSSEAMDQVLAYYRIRKDSISSNKLHAAKYHLEVLRTIGKLKGWRLWYNFFYYAFHGVIKYMK